MASFPTWRRWVAFLVLFFTALGLFLFYSLRSLKPKAPVLVGDWKQAEIIASIRRLKPATAPFARVVTFSPDMTASLLSYLHDQKITDFSFWQAASPQQAEFADFMLHLTIDGRSDFFTNPPAWFKNVYKEVGHWLLPDGAQAFLYQCDPTPIKFPDVGLFNISVEKMTLPGIEARMVSMHAVPLNAEATSVGLLKELTLTCGQATYQGMVFQNLFFRFVSPQINLPRFLETGEIHMLKLAMLYPQISISSTTVVALAEKKLPWLKNPRLSFTGSNVDISAKMHRIPFNAHVNLKINNDQLVMNLQNVSIAGLSIPQTWVPSNMTRNVSLKAHAEIPFQLRITSIETTESALHVK
jgi:hypothetical protein